MKLGLSSQILEEYSKIKFHENRPVGAEFFHANRQTHDKANSLFFEILRTLLKRILHKLKTYRK